MQSRFGEKLFQGNEGMSDQVTDVRFKQFTSPARTKTLEDLANMLPAWKTIGVKVEAGGEVISDRMRLSGLMQLIPEKLEDLI